MHVSCHVELPPSRATLGKVYGTHPPTFSIKMVVAVVLQYVSSLLTVGHFVMNYLKQRNKCR